MPPSYNDMYRAAQDATRDLRDAVTRLSTQLNNIATQVNSGANNTQPQYNDIRRSLADVRAGIAQLFRANAGPARSNINEQYIVQALQRLDARMSTIEAFAKDVSDYLALMQERENGEGRRNGQ